MWLKKNVETYAPDLCLADGRGCDHIRRDTLSRGNSDHLIAPSRVHFKLVASSLPLNPRPVRSLPLVLLPLRGEGVKSGFQVPSPIVG